MNLQVINAVKCNGVLIDTTVCITKCRFYNHYDEITNEIVCNKPQNNITREGKYKNIIKNGGLTK